MLWATLYNKLGRQPMKITQKQHVNAILQNPATKTLDTVFLELKFDTQGNPYFIQDTKPHEDPRHPLKHHRTEV